MTLAIRCNPLMRALRCLQISSGDRGLLLAYCGFACVDARMFQAVENRQLSTAPERPANPLASAPQGLIGRIDILRLGISVIVMEGTAAAQLPGALPDTSPARRCAGQAWQYRNLRASRYLLSPFAKCPAGRLSYTRHTGRRIPLSRVVHRDSKSERCHSTSIGWKRNTHAGDLLSVLFHRSRAQALHRATAVGCRRAGNELALLVAAFWMSARAPPNWRGRSAQRPARSASAADHARARTRFTATVWLVIFACFSGTPQFCWLTTCRISPRCSPTASRVVTYRPCCTMPKAAAVDQVSSTSTAADGAWC